MACGWIVVVPSIIRARYPRIAQSNPDHFTRVVSFHRAWGVAAVLVGLGVSIVL